MQEPPIFAPPIDHWSYKQLDEVRKLARGGNHQGALRTAEDVLKEHSLPLCNRIQFTLLLAAHFINQDDGHKYLREAEDYWHMANSVPVNHPLYNVAISTGTFPNDRMAFAAADGGFFTKDGEQLGSYNDQCVVEDMDGTRLR